MIVLDATVVSERQKPSASEPVVRWLHENRGAFSVTATVVAELGKGIAELPEGRRRLELQDELDVLLDVDFADRVLPFDLDAATVLPLVHEIRRVRGRPIGFADAQIAAVCLVEDAALATRNTRDFEGLGLSLANPREEG